MLAASAAISIRPTFLTAHSLKPRLSYKIFGQRLQLSSGISWNKDIEIRCPNRMSKSFRTRAGDGYGGVGAFEHEAFINGSPNFVANELEATVNNLSKWLVLVFFCLIILWRHDTEALWAATGSVINAGLSTILKRMLNQERPVANLRSDPGMPSSHAQSIFYIVPFAILSMVQFFGLNGYTTGLSGLFVALGSYFSWLRVSQQLHTVSQVLVGALVGTFFSSFWFWSWDSFVLEAFMSYLCVRILVILGSAGFCISFVLYVIRYWNMENLTSYISRKL